ncbi:hypothetical protein SASPL_114272 [Salvia splendens]|uniref:Uncharacterized protein n=1 Tax=Salvia splendens TaxID=180675 RepID=A0A8X9A086_SALSN|nr:hypothetical protein SASPL_114272 [Salvia splendens]
MKTPPTRTPKTLVEDPHYFATELHAVRCIRFHWTFESLLGNGVSASTGELWAYERKVMAPGLNMNKIQKFDSTISTNVEGGKADIKVDNYLIKFARVCFGSNYAEGEQLFEKLQALVQVTAKQRFPHRHSRHENRREWKLRKDVKELISKLLDQKNKAGNEENMLKFILQSSFSPNEMEDFIIDNCKSILLAGYEPVSIAASWILMLLASNKEWQDRVREEVFEVCKGKVPDFDSIRHLKHLTMVIYESLRLYTSAHIESRYAINDLEFASIRIPKGVIIWDMTTSLHTDPDIEVRQWHK